MKSKTKIYRYISSKRKIRENVGPLLNRAGELGTKDTEKVEVLNAASPWSLVVRLDFSNPTSLRTLESLEQRRHTTGEGG